MQHEVFSKVHFSKTRKVNKRELVEASVNFEFTLLVSVFQYLNQMISKST